MAKINLLNLINSYLEYEKIYKIDCEQETKEEFEKYILKNFDLKINSEYVFICLAMIQEFRNKKISHYYREVLEKIIV